MLATGLAGALVLVLAPLAASGMGWARLSFGFLAFGMFILAPIAVVGTWARFSSEATTGPRMALLWFWRCWLALEFLASVVGGIALTGTLYLFITDQLPH